MSLTTMQSEILRRLETGELGAQIAADSAKVEKDTRREIGLQLAEMESKCIELKGKADKEFLKLEEVVKEARANLVVLENKLQDISWKRSAIYSTYSTPQQALRDELRRTAPPIIAQTRQELLAREGYANQLIVCVEEKKNDSMHIYTRELNRQTVEAYKLQLRATSDAVDYLSYCFVEDVEGAIAKLLAKLPSDDDIRRKRDR